MREYLFRGKRSYGDNEWAFGSLLLRGSGYTEIAVVDNEGREGLCLDFRSVIPETVGQFTGMIDIDDIKVFEGDVIKSCVDNPTLKGSYRIGWHLASFGYAAYGKDGSVYSLNLSDFYYIKVIGNIHDNKELLNDK